MTDQLPKLLRASEVAEWLGLTEAALAQDRHRGEGLPFVRFGTRIRYRLDDLLAYVNENTTVPSPDPAPAAPVRSAERNA